MLKTNRPFVLWFGIVLFVVFMYTTLPFSKAIVVDVYRSLGWKYFNYTILVIFVALYLYIHKHIKFNFKNALIISLISIIIFAIYFKTRFPTDRLHIIVYMILGFFIYRAVSLEVKNPYLKFIVSLALVLAVGLEDEILQSYLPNRDMELSDIFRDFVGGLSGILIGKIAEDNFKIKKKGKDKFNKRGNKSSFQGNDK